MADDDHDLDDEEPEVGPLAEAIDAWIQLCRCSRIRNTHRPGRQTWPATGPGRPW